MNVVSTFNGIFALVSSVFLLGLGVWATAFAYGFAGERIVGRFYWSLGFKNHLRWLGPLLVVLTVVCLVFQLDDIAKTFTH